jgi:WD40 repeat protein
MNHRINDTLLAAAQLPGAVPGLAALAFGRAPSVATAAAGKHLAFLPLEALELDLSDPEQCDFGDYVLIEQLGQGGMGVVYRAHQHSLDREVALKLLSAGPWASPDFIARFRREAQSAARLQHPNIVPIYEIGQHAELNFFAMALIRGESLAQRIERDGALPAREAARLVRVIAEALDYAHRLGILHLDLKPANVLVDEHGEPQVADFGLAKRLDESLASDSDEVSGTPSYMAPEQAMARSQRIGVATDIYGLGAILYELMTGRPPFLGATPRQTLEDVVTREVPAPRGIAPDIPADLEAVCLRCLAKDPQQRYLSARGLAEDLGRFLEGRPVSVRPLHLGQRLVRWSRREPRVALAAAGAVLSLLAGLFATSLQWQRAEAHADDARTHLWSARAQTAQAAMAQGDGFQGLRALVTNLGEMEAVGRHAEAAIERQRIGSVLANAPQLIDLIRLPDGEAASALALSPDGRRFAVASYGNGVPRTIRQYDLDRGEMLWETVTDNLTRGMPVAGMSPHGRLAYTPDGTRILSHVMQNAPFPAPTMSDGILLDAETGRVLSPPVLPEDHADFVYSDDGRFALQRSRQDLVLRFPQNGQLFRVDDWSPLGPRLPHSVDNGFEWLFAPDGSALLGSGDFLRLSLFEPATLAVRWTLQLPGAAPVRAWRFSPDGRWLAVGTTQGRIWLVDVRDGVSEELPSTPAATVRWLEFNSNGRTLAARAEDGTLAAWDVATRRPRMAAFRDPRLSDILRLRLVGETLLAAGGNAVHLLELAPPSPFGHEAVPAPTKLRNRRQVHSSAFDLHPGRGLLVIAGSDGQIGIWRMSHPPLRASRAAPLPAARLDFDGERLIAVDGRDVQLVDVDNGAARSPRLRHPQPVRLAERSADGRSLVTVAGRTLRVFDAASGALRGAPLLLPQVPIRAVLAAQSPRLLLTTLEYVDDQPHERLHQIDLETGAPAAVELRVAGPLRGLAIDPQARFLLHHRAGGPSTPHAIAVLALDGQPRCPALELDADHTPGLSTIDADGRAWTFASHRQRRGLLLHWDTATCAVLLRLPVQQASGPNAPEAWGSGVALNQLMPDALSLFSADGRRRDIQTGAAARVQREFALSADGRRAALATRNSVRLFDLEHGERLSAPLVVPIAGNDAIAKLAFAPDGSRLLARTLAGRWLVWNLPAADGSHAELALLTSTLDPSGADPALGDQEFNALRRFVLQRAPAETGAANSAADVLLLAALEDEAVDPRFLPLDLRAVVNASLHEGWPPAGETPGDAPTLALGPQHLNGVDWQVDGVVSLNGGAAASHFGPLLPVTEALSLPPAVLSRVHLLMRINVPMSPQAPPKVAARVLLTGSDGREHVLEVLTRKHIVPTGWNLEPILEPGARIAWLGIGSTALRSGYATSSDAEESVFAVTLDVPPDAGPLRALRLAVGDGPIEAPLIYAVTLEREIATVSESGTKP